ncbi:sec-independent protein translocase TatC [Elizabethkingia argentiflava]|uniref:Sec-independent protein translocase TatC n=1 Tax=Elizabethkingia argenteiflava TaxID=2681556 RepID=A0A845PQ86_9FLAO|nr:group III truncated hemoglobin [Elizabethkingia argenteiflava]NAW50469.1 sec-independent protein translocase TatC [Elizabethkingia argenteiflava]
MKDIQNRIDIELLVDGFYRKVQKDDKISIFFNEIAQVKWNEHLPKMFDFWECLLFGKTTYKGNPMQVHFPINETKAMEKEHFERWLKLWTETIKENFSGKIADLAIYKAQNIANLMSYKMENARKVN